MPPGPQKTKIWGPGLPSCVIPTTVRGKPSVGLPYVSFISLGETPVKELAIYSPVELAEDEKLEIESKLAASFKVLKKASTKLYGFANIKKLRNEYKNGQVQLDDRSKNAMDQIIGLEKRVLSGYIRMAAKPCRKSRNRYGLSVADYLQEAAMAIYDAMYLYNGKTRFSTYAFWCIKNRIVDFYRNESRNLALNDTVKMLGSVTLNRFKATTPKSRRGICGVWDSAAFDALSGKSLEHWEEISPMIMELMSRSIYVSDHDNNGSENSGVQMLLEAVHVAPLTDMERCLIDADLRGDNGFRTRTAETVVNPNTGKLWTKQRLSQLYIRACEKIRLVVEQKRSAAA